MFQQYGYAANDLPRLLRHFVALHNDFEQLIWQGRLAISGLQLN
jgi:hypothetical protein